MPNTNADHLTDETDPKKKRKKKVNMSTKTNANAQQYMLSIQATPDIANIRTLEHMGATITVVPCIALCEGVLWPANAPAPELALAEEFGRFPDSWNGRPIVMNHPIVDGVPVSAGNPKVLAEVAFGEVFNTKLVGNDLHMELWINMNRVTTLAGEVQETVGRLIDGKDVVEVSTGLFTMSEMTEGTFHGDDYSSIWRNIVPDHLALLSKGTTGACSVEGGCGAPRTMEVNPAMKAVRFEVEPATNEAPVINNNQCDCDGGECDDCQARYNSDHKGIFQQLMSTLKGKFSKWEFLGNARHKATSDDDIRVALHLALHVEEPDRFSWVIAVFIFAEGSGEFVYEQGFDGMMFRRSFSIADKGEVTLGKNVEDVRPVTQFVPVEVSVNVGTTKSPSAQESNMKKEERVAALIDNKATKFTKDNTDFLMGLEDHLLDVMTPVELANSQADVSGGTSDTITKDDIDDDETRLPMTLEEHLAELPPEIRAMAESGLATQKAQKAELVKGIKDNKRNAFTDEALEAMDIPALQNLAAFAGTVSDYSGQAVLNGEQRVNAGEDSFTPAPSILSTPETAAAERAAKH